MPVFATLDVTSDDKSVMDNLLRFADPKWTDMDDPDMPYAFGGYVSELGASPVEVMSHPNYVEPIAHRKPLDTESEATQLARAILDYGQGMIEHAQPGRIVLHTTVGHFSRADWQVTLTGPEATIRLALRILERTGYKLPMCVV